MPNQSKSELKLLLEIRRRQVARSREDSRAEGFRNMVAGSGRRFEADPAYRANLESIAKKLGVKFHKDGAA